MDYFSCSPKKKKKNPLIRKLFPRRAKKAKEQQQDTRNSAEEGGDEIEKDFGGHEKSVLNAEQISEMKSMKNDDRLEGKQKSSQAKNKKAKQKKKEGIMNVKEMNKKAVNELNPGGQKARSVNTKVDDSASNGEDKMLKNIVEKHFKSRKPGRKLSDSATEKFVYLDLDDGGKDSSSADQGDGEARKNEDEKPARVRKISKRYFKRRSGDVYKIEENEIVKPDNKTNEMNIAVESKEDNQEAFDEKVKKEHAIDNEVADCDEDVERQKDVVKVEVNEHEGCFGNEAERLEDDREGQEAEALDISKEQSCELEQNESVDKGVDSHGLDESLEPNVQHKDEGITVNINEERLTELEMINDDLKKKIVDLEEDLWLAKEDKINMQAILERQKDKAIKNLAFRFEEINKKTLCEFKGIFEQKLQEINEEKLALQKKLEDLEEERRGVKEEDVLDKQVIAEEKISELEEQNITLKQRCRKLSANLGQLKKQNELLLCDGNGEMIDKMTQTDCEKIEMERKDLMIKYDDSLRMSLNDIHDDVKTIANSIFSFSENFRTESQNSSVCSAKTDDDSAGKNSRCSSLNTEKDTGEEKLQSVSPSANCDPEIKSPQSAAQSDQDSSVDETFDEISIRETEIISEKESFLSVSPIADSSGEDLRRTPNAEDNGNGVTLISESETEKQAEMERKHEDKATTPSSDDGDSGIFGSEFSHLADNEMELQLYRIEDKYRKLSQELENYEYTRMRDTEVASPRVLPMIRETDVEETKKNSFDFDPEIKRLIDEVNLKYNEYFFGNKSLDGEK